MTDLKFDTTGLEDYITSEMLEQEGLWLENFPGGRAFRVKRAGGSNRQYAKRLTAAIKPYRNSRTGIEGIDPAVQDRIMRHVYAQTVVVDWRGIDDVEGDPVPFSPANVEAFFEAFPEIFRDVMTLAGEATMFSERRVQEAEEALGEG